MSKSELHEEHLVLGARMGDWNGVEAPLAYPAGDARAALREGAALVDLSGATMLFSSGEPAEAFAGAVFAGDALAVGECSIQAALVGDGSLAAAPLVARTGEHEYLAFDVSERGETLSAWLSFVSKIEQKGFAPYAGLDCDDVSGKLVPLALWGAGANAVLSDYAQEGELPGLGQVANPALDGRIPTIVSCLELLDATCYLLLVPPAMARVMWRSLLSFESVTPVGVDGARELLREALPWASRLSAGERVELTRAELSGAGLMRDGGGFIGGRGLAE